MEEKFICSKPFNTIFNHPGRHYTPCCWANYTVNESNPNNTLPFDHFDGDDFRRLRKEMMIGEKTDFLYSYCRYCIDREEEVKDSPRKKFKINSDFISHNFNMDGSLIKGTKNRYITLSINIYGNYCNLECYECDPLVSTSRKKAIQKIQPQLESIGITQKSISEEPLFKSVSFDEKNKEQFESIINQIVEYADNVFSIEFVGGEPMLMKSHFKLLDKLIQNNKSHSIVLVYISNMTLMTIDKMKYYFDNFKKIKIQWSVDALQERNHWLRYPTNWDETTKNVIDIQKYLKTTKTGDIIATITPSLLGIVSLRKTYNWLFARKLISKERQIFNALLKPRILRTRNLPDELKEEICKDVKLISEYHYNDLIQPRDEHQFKMAIKYFDLLDQSRGTNWRETFPEVAKYAN